ncbi:putative tri7-like toxin biosynthesis protein [Neofusicoccum parvum UCRNP2]|uniref:Putative tri7-like toxin biosynthesis protein n=1 Tax=Botryosphaeria parva (strain UCR-NP2) TaxID=1287680 RepID=R1GAS5_BOTPV|nr:putative tri7-like toxin biosynthesis protein [Neofusicoccum parvum UCRNP2]
MLYNAVSIIAVATLLNSPADWPPYFGTVADATTLRDFWGKYWHSGLRNPMVANANFVTYDLLRLSRGTLAARYLSIFLTFAISGAIHHLVDSIAGVPAAENTTADLFLMQAVGITVEDFTVWLFERRFAKVQDAAAARKHGWARVLGYVWVCAWLVWVTPPMSYSHIRYELDRFARPGPVGALIAKLR